MKNRVIGWITKKNEDKLALLNIFAATGLTSIFVTRAYLALMNHPQVGGDTLHIAHMLWGGLLLTVVSLYLALVSRPNKKAAVFFGGIGFGLVIDELRKFIAVDNDYFFKPAASLIITTSRDYDKT